MDADATTYRLVLSYDGAPYCGWQRQPGEATVQETLEKALSKLLGVAVVVIGSGRTDAGVHARGQVAHLDLAVPFPVRGLVHGCNQRLPSSIRVVAAHRVARGFHAQKCAHSKEYRYFLSRARVVSPLDAPTTARIQGPFDLALASTATRLLLGEHDFSAFAKTGGAHTSAVRRIFAAEWLEWPDDRLCFRIVGSGFLRGMVRAIVGSLLEVGYGRRSIDGFSSLLYRGQAAGRQDAGPNAPAHGLILHEVSYPDWPALEAWPEAPA